MRLEYVLLLMISVLLTAGCTQQAIQEDQPVPPEFQEIPETPPMPPTPPPTQTVKEFFLEADDDGFYPSSMINVTKGDTVKITFTVKTTNTYFAGLEIRSEAFMTGQIPKGQSKTVGFTADRSFQFTSHWPSTQVLKAIGQVNVI